MKSLIKAAIVSLFAVSMTSPAFAGDQVFGYWADDSRPTWSEILFTKVAGGFSLQTSNSYAGLGTPEGYDVISKYFLAPDRPHKVERIRLFVHIVNDQEFGNDIPPISLINEQDADVCSIDWSSIFTPNSKIGVFFSSAANFDEMDRIDDHWDTQFSVPTLWADVGNDIQISPAGTGVVEVPIDETMVDCDESNPSLLNTKGVRIIPNPSFVHDEFFGNANPPVGKFLAIEFKLPKPIRLPSSTDATDGLRVVPFFRDWDLDANPAIIKIPAPDEPVTLPLKLAQHFSPLWGNFPTRSDYASASGCVEGFCTGEIVSSLPNTPLTPLDQRIVETNATLAVGMYIRPVQLEIGRASEFSTSCVPTATYRVGGPATNCLVVQSSPDAQGFENGEFMSVSNCYYHDFTPGPSGFFRFGETDQSNYRDETCTQVITIPPAP